MIPLKARKGQDYEPYAMRTKLGWMVSGPMNDTFQHQEAICNFIQGSAFEHGCLDKQVEHFWKVDAEAELTGGKLQMSLDDKKVIEIWNQSVKNVVWHYEMDIPFKSDPPELLDNKSMAKKWLQSLGLWLRRDPELHKKYQQVSQTWCRKGMQSQCLNMKFMVSLAKHDTCHTTMLSTPISQKNFTSFLTVLQGMLEHPST